MANLETRWAPEIRVDADKRMITGTVMVYGDRADIAGIFKESFMPGAFEHSDTILNLQHQRTKPVSREGAGMVLDGGGNKLSMRAEIAKTRDGDEAIELVQARILQGLSVEFRAIDEEWHRDGAERIIRRAKLSGLALVDRPAYPQSSVDIRQAYMELHSPRVFYYL